MDRKFLYAVAGLVLLVLAAALTYALAGEKLIRLALVPRVPFAAAPPAPVSAYARDPQLWHSRPGRGTGDPALWTPAGIAAADAPKAALFYIHPTSFFGRDRWNAPIGDAEADQRAALFIRGQASAFNGVAAIWAPRYRQATFGAFLTDAGAAGQALDLAYGDVRAAFDAFLAAQPGDRPIILAGHSQGALHLMRLLKERVAGTPLTRRVVAAYVVGWPVSLTADLPALGLPACTRADEAGCVLSWLSYAEPADPQTVLAAFDAGIGLAGGARRGSALLCTNPLTGQPGGSAPAAANRGTLFPADDLMTATMRAGAIPARCAGRGILLIGPPPELPAYVLPGNNYHVFDYSLFWANVRADAARRLAAFAR
ncbi:DUF3089 domain-containing protein [Sphingomonas changnyeongensis]|uniref:DUF3089 domain-containing protein n=1 Tax=Sphingomonas changnyeongensis TaxID=2698679 RepID=A0A7Z2NVU8_9SPHN|nr:DUF3089 domain-containing protein [Sphingomonas changnyeongensis]QHL90416.1 DUF3089 domain-containing protein [Sphingomonas changnyeongensis]